MRARVEALLRVHDEDSTFLESPATEVRTGFADPPGEGPGTVIGPYTLLRHLGEGGMGTVYLAEQTRPVRRQVALKILKPGLDARVIARFEVERQALALMNHPHIATVHDAGTTPAACRLPRASRPLALPRRFDRRRPENRYPAGAS